MLEQFIKWPFLNIPRFEGSGKANQMFCLTLILSTSLGTKFLIILQQRSYKVSN